MKTLTWIILLLLSCSFLEAAKTESIGVKGVVTLKNAKSFSPLYLKKILLKRKIKVIKDLWTPSEKNILASLGMADLSFSWVVEFKNIQQLLELEKSITLHQWPLVVDDYEMDVHLTDADFTDLQWGIKNRGIEQVLDLDPVQNFRVPGIASEDINSPLINKQVDEKSKVLVAVLDTGIDKEHPNLKDVIYRNEKECEQLLAFSKCVEDESDRDLCEKKYMTKENPKVDADGNGYPLDCSGWSILGSVNQAGILGRPDFIDDQGHGTHVAGIIAAKWSQSFKGVNGVSSRVKILPVQVIGKRPSEPIKPLSADPLGISSMEVKSLLPKKTLGDMIARGLLYAIKSKAQVINFSLGWPATRDSFLLKSMVESAIKRGIFVVAAAGNDSTRALLRPCAYEGVICVASHGPDGAISHFSNYGSGVDLAAPGLNILSTYPLDQRPIRFRKTWGFEFISGTSQAAPFVTGVIADMLALGVPRNEIYPRLMLGSRSSKENLGIIEGAPHLKGKSIRAEDLSYKKFTLGGNIDYGQALKVEARPLILPVVKEKTSVDFDLKQKTLHLPLKIKNFWQSIAWSDVQIKTRFRQVANGIRPQIKQIHKLPTHGSFTEQSEITLDVEIEINDDNPRDTRIPGDLDLEVSIFLKGQKTKVWIQEYELLVPVSISLNYPGIQKFKIKDFPSGQVEWNPIDEPFDNQPTKKDYILTQQEKNNLRVSLLTQNENGDYVNIGTQKIQIKGKVESLRTQFLTRLPIKNQTHYILGFLDDNSSENQGDSSAEQASKTQFFIFNQSFNLVESFTYLGDKAPMPFQIYWMSLKGIDNRNEIKKPCWVGYGKKTVSKKSLIDLWENPQSVETPEIRFYYLDEFNQLQSINEVNGFKIIDILEPTLKQKEEGVIPVILAKNSGTESKPSYIYDFARAEVTNGIITHFEELKSFSNDYKYRNLIETRVDKILNLDLNKEEFQGTY
ncbi:MAG: S8 family serine peptidase, partial [Bdellovibrionaceae bacterium]|nr:S8 family serine peptidase [Pseudobdellovibrionaceae bacterium]